VFLLFYILFRGASDRAGVLLGLYQAEQVDQYQWPAARLVLFAPVALVVIAAAAYRAWRTVLRLPTLEEQALDRSRLPARMIDLMTIIGAVGCITIWPEKIGALYAVLLCFALFAFTRLNRHFDEIDGRT
jgi:hypothetical protein